MNSRDARVTPVLELVDAEWTRSARPRAGVGHMLARSNAAPADCAEPPSEGAASAANRRAGQGGVSRTVQATAGESCLGVLERGRPLAPPFYQGASTRGSASPSARCSEIVAGGEASPSALLISHHHEEDA
jgi:hypothetical protein